MGEVHSGVERVCDVDVRCVEMRVRDGYGGDTAEGADSLDRCIVENGHAVPQDVTGRSAHEQRPLTDGDGGSDADTDQVGLLLAELVHVVVEQLVPRRPALALPTDVLPLVQADRASLGPAPRVRVLDGAGGADPGGHGLLLRDLSRSVSLCPCSAGSRHRHRTAEPQLDVQNQWISSWAI